jgi:hypothetical protein
MQPFDKITRYRRSVVFKNGVKGAGLMGFQPNVFNSIPGDSKYIPLWRVNLVE